MERAQLDVGLSGGCGGRGVGWRPKPMAPVDLGWISTVAGRPEVQLRFAQRLGLGDVALHELPSRVRLGPRAIRVRGGRLAAEGGLHHARGRWARGGQGWRVQDREDSG
eukprot:3014147-Pyramimonas_sp.AAC.1